MPWQQDPAYYAELEKTERPHNYRRLHLNEWVSSQDALVQMPMWDALADQGGSVTTPLQPVVVGVDAAVSGDCTALSAVAMDGETAVELETWVFEPPDGGKIDYDETLRPALESMFTRYRVTHVAYDEYQLHHLMTNMAKDHRRIVFTPFSQMSERTKADTSLVNRIYQGTLRHTGNEDLRQHIANADAKYVQDEKALRIVKRAPSRMVDAAVALSMACWTAGEIQPAARAVRVRATGLYKRGRRR